MRMFPWSTQGKNFASRGRVQRRRSRKSLDLRRRPRGEHLEDRVVLSALLGTANPNETVSTAVAANELAQSLVGPGVTVSNATFTGGQTAKGSFQFTDPTVIGFDTGIVLASGNAADVVGPNTADWTSTDFAGAGDGDLTNLSGFPTYDASILEFDFVPTANQVVFSYAFASDEYPEWVNTPFNDVFAFYVNGTNYATVRQVAGDPNAPFVPVAVNNINNGNPEYYPDFTPQRPDLFRANYVNPTGGPSAIDLELDGITHVLTFQAPVNPNVVNHMKLAIADASDGIYDSAVFIQAGSLVSNENPVADLSLSPEVGAAPLLVTAFIEGEDPNGLPLTFSIDWGDGSPDSSGSLLLPADESEKTAQVDHVYASPGEFIVTLTVSNGAASDVSIEDVDVLSVQIGAPVVTLQPTDQTALVDGPFTFSAAAMGVPAPSVQWQVSTDSGATFVNIPGANAASYSSVATLGNDGYQYRAVFTNSEGSATTVAATLHVSAEEFAPVVTSDPVDQEVSAGDLFSFTAAASAMPAPTVQWQLSTDAGATWTDIEGATEATYSALASETDDGNQYRAVFTNTLGEATSQPAILSVSTEDVDLSVTSNPSDQAVVEGDAFTFSAAAVGAQAVQWQVSLDSGATFTDIPGATNATYSAVAALSDNGSQYRAVFFADADDLEEFVATFAAVLEVRPPAPVVSLANDTGSFPNDALTQDGTLAVGGLTPGAAMEFSVDQGATWSDHFTAAEGLNTILVRQTSGGVPSDATTFEFILDATLPKPPRVDLAEDTGSSPSDHVTQAPTLVLTNVETGARVEYSIDGGVSWGDSFTAVEGPNTVKVRQTDLAGNISDAALLSFLLDTATAAPGAALAADTGASPSDHVTKDGTLALSGVEENAAVEYSLDGGDTWSSVFSSVEGVNSLLLRQVDPAGNVSDATTLNFVLDTTPPTLNPTFSTGNAFLLVNQKNVTVAPNASDQFGIASQSAGNVDTSTAGLKSVNCAATDMAGNTSSVDVPYTVGYAFVNVRPQPGASYPAKGTLTVSFQLSDANGVIKDSTAAKLVRNIVVNLDDAPRGSVKYNRRTDKFTVRLQLSKIPVGSHEMEIFVKVNGVDIAATGSIPFTVFPS